MRPFSRLIKAALALTASALMFQGLLAHAGEQPPAKKPAAAAPAPKAEPKGTAAPAAVRTVALRVTEKGYEPSPVSLKRGEPVRLVITRTSDETCATDLVMADPKLQVELPLNKPVEVTFTPTKSGQLKYGCSMGQMISGVFLVE
jgi:plastocyanin domain-containing protein